MQTQTTDTWLELPQKLTRENRWTLWRLAKQLTPKGRPTIDLFQAAAPEQAANVEDPYSWSSFSQAHEAVLRGKGQGLAYINSRYTPIVTITFYNALIAGKLAPWTMRYFDILNAYAEEGIMPNSLVMLYEGGGEKPLTWGNIAIRRNPFVVLTGKHLPGSPARVGTSPTRLEAFISDCRRDFERLIKRRGGDPQAHMAGKNLERLLASLEGVRKTGPNRWVACLPGKGSTEASLSIRLENGRILLYDHAGADVKTIIARLGIGYGGLAADDTPPELPGRSAPVLVRPLEGAMLERVSKAQHRLRSMGRLPKSFESLGFSYRDAVEAGLGASNNDDGVIVYSDLEGRPLSAQLQRGVGSDNGVYSMTPGHAVTSWLGPGLAQAQSGIVVVQGVLNAVLVWSLVRQDGLGVIGLPDVQHDPGEDFLKRLSLQNVYLYADPQEKRQAILERWANPFRKQGFPAILLPELVPGGKLDPVGFVRERGQQALLERLVELGVGN